MKQELFSKCEEAKVDELYLNGKSVKFIERETGISKHSLYDYLKVKNIPIRSVNLIPLPSTNTRRVPPVGSKFGLLTVISDEVRTDIINDKPCHAYVLCEMQLWKSRMEIG